MDKIITNPQLEGRFGRSITLMDYILQYTRVLPPTDEVGDIDMVFINVTVSSDVNPVVLLRLMGEHRMPNAQPTPIELLGGLPYTYIEVALWLGETHETALRFMALGVALDIFRLLTPRDYNEDPATIMLFARMGAVAVIANVRE